MDLAEFRKQLDAIDDQIVALYEERMAVSEQIAAYKIKTGKAVLDREREQSKLAELGAKASNDFNRRGVEELYRQIMAMSRKLQYRKINEAGTAGRLPFIGIDDVDRENIRVVFQGAEGSYSQAAMKQFFGEDVNSFPVETFRDAMIAIEDGRADYGVLPIENSTAGMVSEIYDLLSAYENTIVAEQIMKIEHCLLGLPGSSVDRIATVYAHPQALMQSYAFLYAHPSWKQVGMKNNAFAVQKVLADNDPTQAAIAGEYAARYYGMEILERGINRDGSNSTRFVIITNQKVFLKNARCVSISFELPHEPGALYRMLSHIIYNDLNMTRIESRPIPDMAWEYRFFVDFEGNLADDAVKNALRGLREEARNLRILGNY
ncbi:MAG: prephenate dehydratase [Lachnospiraceae bacterium]|nr:prephenate dehydratase [Lachnospiraceae bacterium]